MCINAQKKAYRETHKAEISTAYKEWYAANREYNLERSRKYINDNRDRLKIAWKCYRELNKEKRTAYTKQWRADNPNKVMANRVEWYAENRDAYLERCRKRHHENKELRNQKSLDWHRRNPYKSHLLRVRRRARIQQSTGSHTVADVQAIWEMQNGRCLYCDTLLDGARHIDHYIPISKGGRNSKENLAWACAQCNFSKADKFPWNWHGWNGAKPVFWDGTLL